MCYWCFNAKNLNIEFLFSASRRRPRGLAISIIKGIIPERLIHPFVNECLLDVGALPGTTLAAHQGTTWAHFLTSLPKAPKYPRTKEEQGETRSSHISAAMRSPQRTRWPRPLRTVRWSGEGPGRALQPPPTPRSPGTFLSSGNPSCFCVALSRTKKAKKRNKHEIALRVGMNHSCQRWQNPSHLTLGHRNFISFRSGLPNSVEQDPLL